MNLKSLSESLAVALVATFITAFPLEVSVSAAAPHSIIYNNGVCELSPDYEGVGSVGDPYKISDSESLWEIADCSITQSSRAHFVLTRDIDLNGALLAPTHSPIGFSAPSNISFMGVLDGRNYSILGLSMSSSEDIGLFAEIYNASISNLNIYGNLTSSGLATYPPQIGAISPISDGHVEIVSVSNFVNVSGTDNVGGFIGTSEGILNISSSNNFGHVIGQAEVGGFVGYLSTGTLRISHSANLGAVVGSGNNVGGLVGYNDGNDLEIAFSQNTGRIAGSYGVGGLLGSSEGSDGVTISHGLNNAEISGEEEVGGLVGLVGDELAVSFSVNAGTVSGVAAIGGLVGSVEYQGPPGFFSVLEVTKSTNSGNVRATSTHSGGLVGFVQSLVASDFVNSGNVVGSAFSGGLAGEIVEDSLLVRVRNLSAISGSDRIGGLVGAASFGALDISSSSNEGPVFGLDYSGGLVGAFENPLEIASSFNRANVTGTNNVGGLVGWGESELIIQESYHSGAVSGNDYVGGIAGVSLDDSYLEDVYTVGSVSGSGFVGGLIGDSSDLSLDFTITLSRAVSAIVVSGTTDVDGLIGTTSEQVDISGVYVLESSNFVPSSLPQDLRIASTFNGLFDFDAVWGFGSCSDNNGLPMLRVFGDLVSYSSIGCTVVAQNNPQNSQQQVAEPATPTPPRIPIFDAVIAASPGSEVVVTGRNFDLFVAISADGLPLTISSQTDQRLTLIVPILGDGSYDLVALTRNAGVTYLGQLMIIRTVVAVGQVRDQYLTGLNPRSSWLNGEALDQAAAIQPQGARVTCLAYQDRPGATARSRALSRAEHACRTFKKAGYETKLVAYSKAPAMASKVKLTFSN